MERKRSNGELVSGVLSDVLPDFREGERWIFVSPHDDDAVIGAGLLIQEAIASGVSASLRIVTDGSMGYTDLEERDRIVEIRRAETYESYGVIGLDDIAWFGYRDNDLYRHCGRRRIGPPSDETIDAREGHTGLQNSLTAEIRALRPTRVLVCAASDYHPDHKLTFQETMISVFHATGTIWPELGDPWSAPTRSGYALVYEYAVYAPYAQPPDHRLQSEPENLERKLDAISRYRSQRQIGKLVEQIGNGGAIEFLRTVPFDHYSPDTTRF
jgi:LmbE family N-acetylglucosaminyl deacetylase